MRKKFNLLFVFIFMCIISGNIYAQQDVNGWYWMNGQPAGVTLNWSKVLDASNIYAVGNRGLFMKSSDGGDSWTITQAGAPDLSTTGAGGTAKRDLFTGWFFDANTGIVAGASQTGSPSKTVVSKTTNGGNTWTIYEVNSTAGGSVNSIYFINSTTGYLCGGTNARLYKTTNQGLTWTNIASVPANTYYSLHAFDENKIILGTSSRRIIRTTDAGATWNVDTIFSAATNVQFLGMEFKDANTGYVIGNPNFFAYTTNAGTSWNASTHSSIRGQRAIVYDAGTVWTAGDYEYVYRSTNNGVNWDSVKFYDNSNPNQPSPFIIYGIGANGNDLIVTGASGQLTTSNDGGASWRNKNYSVGVSSTYSSIWMNDILIDPKIWVGGNSGGMLYSSNGGTNWTSQTTSHSTTIFKIDFVNSATGYIAGGNAFAGLGEMSKTTDGGATWTYLALPSPLSTYQLNTVDFVNATTGWTGGTAGLFTPNLTAKTTDGGATWNLQNLETAPLTGTTNLKMVDENIGYLVSNSLYKTTNGGATDWVKNIDPYVTGTSWSNLFVLNKDVVYLCGNGTGGVKKIIRSMDGGQTWTDLTGNLDANTTIFNTKWLNLKHGIVMGTSGYSAKTTDGGLTWAVSNPGFSTTVDGALSNKNTWFTVCDRNGSYQIGRKLSSLTSISLNVTMSIEGFWNGKPHVRDTVRVELHNSSSPFALVDVAKEVITVNGYQTYEFNSAPSGSYYIVLKHRNGLETWSAAPVAMTAGGNYNYDFTTASSQAYGNNMVLKAGKYCIYSGDANQDGVVDITDLGLIDNDGFNFASGYLSTDCNGDDVIDLTDLGICDNNANNTVGVIKP
ncbi:MAG: hypothetical protein JSS91_04445 [Bacteroidetes bacterium]|nr:hypothetical protein [Bacteroidota bacterium]